MSLVSATTEAQSFERLFWLLSALSLGVLVLVASLVIGFSIRFRSGSAAPRHRVSRIHSRELEIGWTSATAFVALFIFWWTASSNLHQQAEPVEAMQIQVMAKQWMWKAAHASGVRELGSLHVPVGTPVELNLNSQDVIHSFFVPAFRLKQDVVPGRTTTLRFEASAAGRYDLLCAEFCGTGHSAMTGEIVVMQPDAFSRWLDSRDEGEGLAAQGRRLFSEAGCSGCHAAGSSVHAPSLAGLYGRRVPLADGRIATVDAAYLRNSILLPRRDVAAGYKPIMPDFQGLLDEDEIEALIAYLRNLGEEPS